MAKTNTRNRTTKGTPAKTNNNIVKQKISGNVRLLFYGGAPSPADNSSFQFAAKNVKKDYNKKFPTDTVIFKFVDSAKIIVDTINSQKKGRVSSLDLFFHGSKWGLYIYKGSSMSKKLPKDDISPNNLNAGLYGSNTTELTGWWDGGKEQKVIYDIDFDRFIENGAIIEIHGCESGGDLLVIDSISKNLSEELPNGYVIGHLTKANPNIGGTTVNEQQDYRHGQRAIWKNGKVIKKTTKEGWLDPNDFEKDTSH